MFSHIFQLRAPLSACTHDGASSSDTVSFTRSGVTAMKLPARSLRRSGWERSVVSRSHHRRVTVSTRKRIHVYCMGNMPRTTRGVAFRARLRSARVRCDKSKQCTRVYFSRRQRVSGISILLLDGLKTVQRLPVPASVDPAAPSDNRHCTYADCVFLLLVMTIRMHACRQQHNATACSEIHACYATASWHDSVMLLRWACLVLNRAPALSSEYLCDPVRRYYRHSSLSPFGLPGSSRPGALFPTSTLN